MSQQRSLGAQTQAPTPRRGEVWRAQLDPARGSEQAKTRPVVVLTEPPIGRATMRLCVPIVHALPVHLAMSWCAALLPGTANGLSKSSTADASQTRALDLVRFEARLGTVSADDLEAITTALVLCIGRRPAA